MKSVKLQWIKRERRRLGIQMHANEIFFIVRAIRPPVNFLVFGMGNDSAFWFKLNQRGRTVFVEDQEEWFRNVHGENPFLEAYLVTYGTTLSQAMQLIDSPGRLAMDLPPNIRKTAWDLILIDGPAGYEDNTPGRMKSIYEASRLIKQGGSIFVHDQEREVERAYGDRYLLKANVVGEVKGRATLRHYRYRRATGWAPTNQPQ
jgi:glucuronoxylan 4-O-methyltransferase